MDKSNESQDVVQPEDLSGKTGEAPGATISAVASDLAHKMISNASSATIWAIAIIMFALAIIVVALK